MRLNRLKVSNCDKETGGPKGEHRFIQANSFGYWLLSVEMVASRPVNLATARKSLQKCMLMPGGRNQRYEVSY